MIDIYCYSPSKATNPYPDYNVYLLERDLDGRLLWIRKKEVVSYKFVKYNFPNSFYLDLRKRSIFYPLRTSLPFQDGDLECPSEDSQQ